jgi:hypothetical protein
MGFFALETLLSEPQHSAIPKSEQSYLWNLPHIPPTIANQIAEIVRRLLD